MFMEQCLVLPKASRTENVFIPVTLGVSSFRRTTVALFSMVCPLAIGRFFKRGSSWSFGVQLFEPLIFYICVDY